MLCESCPAVSVPANPVCVSPPVRLKPSRYVSSVTQRLYAVLSRPASQNCVCEREPECLVLKKFVSIRYGTESGFN